LLFIFSLSLFLISLVGCCRDIGVSFFKERSEAKSQPSLKVEYKDNSIDGVRGPFSWTTVNRFGKKSTIYASTRDPKELVKGTTPLTVSPKSTITLNFSDKPENISVNIWQGNGIIKQEVTDSKVITPEIKGPVIYEVSTDWNQGTVCYAFLVIVD
jgi:hypothetical protein